MRHNDTRSRDMNHEEFYHSLYYRSHDNKSEINNSLSTPIGILTALIAGLFYVLTNFEFENSKALTIVFLVVATVAVSLLSISIWRLIKAFSDAHDGYDYAYLPDAGDLNHYHASLRAFYSQQTGVTNEQAVAQADREFNEYLLGLAINAANINQKNNKRKLFHRFQCHQYMIYAFISVSLLVVPFGINFISNKGKDKVQHVSVTNTIPIALSVRENSRSATTFKTNDHGQARNKKADTATHSDDSRRRRP
ncbi:hypothetical protein [Hufsiella ginkgonis]|uniref:Uncharacterized protein n=1 Tax=Hufsiella ginkgonis TaxID=2695274 RepID=A0A7K1XTG8_9SPHI|nr:hypothetical protein [Hufsiella ginkgonis]MXV14305.1 hypothetical protein [Hufsiella ginkgonis]